MPREDGFVPGQRGSWALLRRHKLTRLVYLPSLQDRSKFPGIALRAWNAGIPLPLVTSLSLPLIARVQNTGA